MHVETNLAFHIQVLFRELSVLKERDPRYSMRAFATHLEIHPSALSRAMAGKEDLSIQACLRMLRRLPLTEDDKLRFVMSVANDRYERAMRALSQELSVASKVSLTPERIVIFGKDVRCQFISPLPVEFLRKPPSCIIGKKPSEVGLVPELAVQFEKQVKEAFEKRKPSHIKFDIGKRYIRSAYPILGVSGEIESVLCRVRTLCNESYDLCDETVESGSTVEMIGLT